MKPLLISILLIIVTLTCLFYSLIEWTFDGVSLAGIFSAFGAMYAYSRIDKLKG